MTSFSFEALLKFLQDLFNAFVALFTKMGFTLGGDEAAEG